MAACLDTALVVTFAAIGRRNHDEEPGLAGLVSTAAPFLIGLAVGWIIIRAWNRPLDIRTGLMIWPITVSVGMLGRRIIGDGTAVSFVIVAACFVGATLVGWRAVRAGVAARRSPS
ncbi:MAG: DUF3054 domain-containing protein [Ilumatobacter sp.]